MAKKQSNTTTVVIVVVVVLVLGIILMQSKDDARAPSSTQPTVDEAPVPELSAPEERTTTEDAPSTEEVSAGALPAPAPTPAPAPSASMSAAEVDAALQALDSGLTEEDYDASNVTELFEEETDESLTQPYEL